MVCMPADRQPLLDLEPIVVIADSMEGTLPESSRVPNLKELVIKASGLSGILL